MHIDFVWLTALLRREPRWYIQVAPILKELNALVTTNRDEYEDLKEQVYDVFEKTLADGSIVLGNEAGIWDDERKPVDQVIIHHTSNLPGIRPLRLSAIELFRLYVPAYTSPTAADKAKVVGKPISSGHVRDGKQQFSSYHWIVREDGRAERLLCDNEIGWHAGKWAVNCRSIGICFDGDFEFSRPSDLALNAVGTLIRHLYPQVTKENILGHCEVRDTSCPSNLFLSKDGQQGWKEDLLALI